MPANRTLQSCNFRLSTPPAGDTSSSEDSGYAAGTGRPDLISPAPGPSFPAMRRSSLRHLFLATPLLGVAALMVAAVPRLGAQEPTPTPVPLTLAERAAQVRVQPGDRVAVRVFREPGLSDTVTVDVDGGLALPRLGTIPTRALSVAALHDTLRARYAGFLRNPSFELSVLRRVVVNGEVNKPGVYFVDIGSTLRDVIAQAGGIADLGDAGRVSLVREGTVVPMRDWERRTDELRSGDQVLVGKRSWLSRNALGLTGTVTALASVIISLIVVTR